MRQNIPQIRKIIDSLFWWNLHTKQSVCVLSLKRMNHDCVTSIEIIIRRWYTQCHLLWLKQYSQAAKQVNANCLHYLCCDWNRGGLFDWLEYIHLHWLEYEYPHVLLCFAFYYDSKLLFRFYVLVNELQ